MKRMSTNVRQAHAQTEASVLTQFRDLHVNVPLVLRVSCVIRILTNVKLTYARMVECVKTAMGLTFVNV